MRIVILLFLLVIVLVSGCTELGGFQNNNQQSGTPKFRCDSFAPGKGIVARFSDEGTQEVIHDSEYFNLVLQFANHHNEPVAVDLTLTDTEPENPRVGSEGIQILKRSITIDGASDEIGFEPGCRILEEGNFPLLTLQDNVYRGIDYTHDVTFLGKINYYQYVSETSFNLCVYNPVSGLGQNCTQQEIYGGNALGPTSQYDPVQVTSIRKRLIGARDEVKIVLEIEIDNVGQGYASGIPQSVTFHIGSFEGLQFSCTSDKTLSNLGGDTLDLFLENDRVSLTCQTSISSDRTETYNVFTEMYYDYEYQFVSRPVELRRREVEQAYLRA